MKRKETARNTGRTLKLCCLSHPWQIFPWLGYRVPAVRCLPVSRIKIIDLCGRENLTPHLASGFARFERGRSIDPLVTTLVFACRVFPRVTTFLHASTIFLGNSQTISLSKSLCKWIMKTLEFKDTYIHKEDERNGKLLVAYFRILPTLVYVLWNHLSCYIMWPQTSKLQICSPWRFVSTTLFRVTAYIYCIQIMELLTLGGRRACTGKVHLFVVPASAQHTAHHPYGRDCVLCISVFNCEMWQIVQGIVL